VPLCNLAADPTSVALVATLTSTLAVIVAAAVTAWMAIETRRMATATKRSVDLEYLPILGIRDVRVGVASTDEVQIDATRSEPTAIDAVTVAIELYNAGRVGLTYRMKSMRVTFAGRTTDAPQYLSRGGTVLPGSSTFFWHPPLPLSPPVNTFPAKGRIYCEFEYKHDASAPPGMLSATLEYVVAGPKPGSATNWFFVDEPPSTTDSR
jgi:hypothetical protein